MADVGQDGLEIWLKKIAKHIFYNMQQSGHQLSIEYNSQCSF
jgi:hypothetical protein